MHIPTYQIQNVIKGYIRHYCKSGSDKEVKSFFNQFKGFEDRKDDVLNKTALDIVERILKLKRPEKMTEKEQKSEFVFKTVDKDGNIVENILSVEKNNFKVKPLK